MEGISKKDIYEKSKSWAIKNFKSADNLTKLNDSDFNELIVSGTVKIDSVRLPYLFKQYSKNSYLNFKLIIKCKDGKYKYEIENFKFFFNDYTNEEKIIESELENIKPG